MARTVLIHSFRDVFNDGPNKLHPGFRLGGLLFILTHTKPKLTQFLEIGAEKIESAHFKSKKSIVFLTIAYNQGARKFNDRSGGNIALDQDDIDFLRANFTLQEDLI